MTQFTLSKEKKVEIRKRWKNKEERGIVEIFTLIVIIFSSILNNITYYVIHNQIIIP